MSTMHEEKPRKASGGIRITLINVLLILFGLILSAGIISSTYRTENTFHSVYSTSDTYMISQQTTGMLDTLSASMKAECRAFLEDGDPSYVHAFSGQLSALNEQLEASAVSRSSREDTEADLHLDNALAAFLEMNETELRAMRLAAETRKVPVTAYPELLQKVELSEEDLALTPEQKMEKAEALLSSDAFTAAEKLMNSEIDVNHRLNSEISRKELDEGVIVLRNVVRYLKVCAFLFIIFAVLALIANHLLIVRPIQHSVKNLDRREEIPVRGSYEVRHMAEAYNSLLEENTRKQEVLAYTAAHDALTQVLNRGAFEEVYHSDSLNDYGALIIADVDHFKYYNDNHGHDTGDLVLQAVVNAFREHIRSDDLLFRIGGDEFVVLLKSLSTDSRERVMELIRLINEKLSSGADGMPCLTISAGIAYREDLKEGEDLFKCADTALLWVKDNGRRGCAIYGA